MPNLTIVANIYAKLDKINLVREELEKLIPTTRGEQGCLQYDLHQDNENPAHFIFFESWQTRELWQDHMSAPHVSAFLIAAENAVEDFSVNEMTHLT
ncbi:putative quinol monooxygenase [Kiloniella antarctica]|uniref:Quinol monooxygenase n=1 Tax=Kiloniella antarctica TaxID=1550907 RepID=A0ABW5BJ63_9PROT